MVIIIIHWMVIIITHLMVVIIIRLMVNIIIHSMVIIIISPAFIIIILLLLSGVSSCKLYPTRAHSRRGNRRVCSRQTAPPKVARARMKCLA